LEPAPHVAAVITNLSDKAALVTRMRDALTGEMNRRQEVLRAGPLLGCPALPA
jgi:DNA segregation ATPase FtsK/SpoIIIE, S-DNA-T family